MSPDWVEAMLRAARSARELGIPVVFDPVGAGATAYRTGMALMGIAGELSVSRSDGPGSLQVQFFDVLYGITLDDIERLMKVEVTA